jgi:hypothetical protein
VALFDNETNDSSLDRFANDVTDSLVVALTENTLGAYPGDWERGFAPAEALFP